ncbi:hypothetical protein [Streptomyces sp. NPDC019890]|uniref:hypothetical protein n=1 Tax=Streptomyces sp. NPDC019890 TaxID=3365064 RepID=UPI00384EA630
MTTATDRALIISSVTANALSAATILAGAFTDLPDAARPLAITVAGAASCGLVWKFLTISRADLTRKLMLGATAVITALCVALFWPGRSLLGGTDAKPTAAGQATALEVDLDKAVAQLRQSIQPAQNAAVGTCTSVSGKGTIPFGYEIWVANLSDARGAPNTARLYNLQRASLANGTWQTPVYGVGLPGDTGKQFWINVFLLPVAAGSILALTLRGDRKGWNSNLFGSIGGAVQIDEIHVERTSNKTCPWDPR